MAKITAATSSGAVGESEDMSGYLLVSGWGQGNRMNAMRLPVKWEETRGKGAPGLLFGLRLAKTLFVCAASSSADGFTLPSSPFSLAASAPCDYPADGITADAVYQWRIILRILYRAGKGGEEGKEFHALAGVC